MCGKERILAFLRGQTVQRVMRGVFANMLSQSVIMATQLIVVPIFANLWGAERYGIWILLFTVPSYLALGDFGFGTAAGFRMTMEVAAGRKDAALATFQSAAVVIAAAAGVIGAIGLLTIGLLPVGNWNTHGWTPHDVRLALSLLYAYGVVSLLSSLPAGGFLCVGLYALGTTAQTLTMLAEVIVALAIVLSGGGIVLLGAGYLVTRSVAIAVQMALLRRQVPLFAAGFSHVRLSVIGELLQPALAVMALPIAQALFLQGTALTVGLTVGPAAVAGFTTVRTLVRTGVQFTTLFNHAVMPEMSVASVSGNVDATRRIAFVTVAVSLAVALPGALLLSLFGQDVIHIWTRAPSRWTRSCWI